MAPSSLSAAIAAADRFFAGSSAVGVVFDLAAFGGPDRDGGFAAFARRSDPFDGRRARLVGLAWSADKASDLLARDGRPLFPLGG